MNRHPSLMQIERHVARELPVDQTERLVAHLSVCLECRDILARLDGEACLLKEVLGEAPGFESVAGRISGLLTERREAPRVHPRRYPLVRRLAWTCAGVIAVSAPSLWALLALNPAVPSAVNQLARAENPLAQFLVATFLRTLC